MGAVSSDDEANKELSLAAGAICPDLPLHTPSPPIPLRYRPFCPLRGCATQRPSVMSQRVGECDVKICFGSLSLSLRVEAQRVCGELGASVRYGIF